MGDDAVATVASPMCEMHIMNELVNWSRQFFAGSLIMCVQLHGGYSF